MGGCDRQQRKRNAHNHHGTQKRRLNMLVHRFGGNDGTDDAGDTEDKKHGDDHAFVQAARGRQNRIEVRVGRELTEHGHDRQEIELLQTRALQDHGQTLQRAGVGGFANRQDKENHHEHQSRADADDEKRHVPAKEVAEVCSDRNAQHCRHNGAAHHGGQSDGSLAVRCHTGGKRRHD